MSAERLVSVIWIIFGAAIAYTGYGHGLGAQGEPGSGFMTFFSGLFVVAMAVIIYIQSYTDKEMAASKLSDPWKGANWMRSVWIVVLTLGFVLLIDVLGYFVTSILLLVTIMRFLEDLSWSKSIVIPICTIAGTYLLFKSLLDINLPRGVIGLW